MTSILRKNLEKDYGLTLSWRFAEVELLGLPKLKDEQVFRLEHIYVPLRLCRDWGDRFDSEKTFHVPKALQEQHHLIVLGDPGSGKSTLVKVLTYAFGEANDNAYKRACGELIPIPIILRDYKTRSWQSYQEMLRDFIATLDEDIRKEITVEWLLERLRHGKAILLIDGMDEVGSSEDRRHLRDLILKPLLRDAPKSWALVTSRIVGYDEVSFENVELLPGEVWSSGIPRIPQRCYVAPFNDEEIAQFITRWYELRERFQDRQREGVDSLMRALKLNDRVKQLAHNPQLLTLIALIHRVTANLPSGRVELYDKIVEAYLETIQVYRKLGTPAKLDEMKRWLAKVGWEMQVRRDEKVGQSADQQTEELLFSRAEVRACLIEQIAKERGHDEAPTVADRFLDYVARRSGLLVPRGPDEFSFAHLTFQEYFAAFELRGWVRRFEYLSETCTELATKQHWHETLSLLFEMLIEFHGACDDLFDAMATRTTDTRSTAQFFSLLAPDDQSGLSSAKRREATRFALTRSCESYDDAIIKNLTQLGTSQLTDWVRLPLTQLLVESDPTSIGRDFFPVGDELLEDWPQQVQQAVEQRGGLGWSVEQVRDMTLIGRTSREVVEWAAGRLPLSSWVQPAYPGLFGQSMGLMDLTLRPLVENPGRSARHLLLAQASLAFMATSLDILRAVTLTRDLTWSMEWASTERHLLIMNFIRGVNKDNGRYFRLALARSLVLHAAWSKAHFASIGSVHTLYNSENLAGFLRLVLDGQTESPLRPNDNHSPLVNLGAAAQSLALQTDHAPDRSEILADLREFLSATDDWTRLQAISHTMSLGAGSRELCEERNRILDKALKEPASLTFPKDLDEVTRGDGFVTEHLPKLIRSIFVHTLDQPVLKPEWFDTNHKESRFFLSSFSEFTNLAAEVLDPEGKTELAKLIRPSKI